MFIQSNSRFSFQICDVDFGAVWRFTLAAFIEAL